MSQFSALLVLAMIWLVVALPLSRAAKKQKQAGSGASPASGRKNAGGAPADEPAAFDGEGPDPVRTEHRPLQPTVGIGLHDDSLYRGSLNAETGEGIDPCHDEQMEPLTRISAEPVTRPVPASPALQLGWTADDVVRGVVMSEILNRKRGPYDS